MRPSKQKIKPTSLPSALVVLMTSLIVLIAFFMVCSAIASMEAQVRHSGMPAGLDFFVPTELKETAVVTSPTTPVASWSVVDVCAWLSAPPLSLSKHAPKFQEAGVDG